ncbi:MAG: metallopeptidase TldD-related protein [Gammaproteobacteria bacterium]|nr:metallopeptidase TldD-related protein [Gammaproteobacteria bacterium]
MSKSVRRCQRLFVLPALLFSIGTINAERIDDPNVLEAMHQELERSMSVLAEQPDPPFYISYEITDNFRAVVSTSFGKVTRSSESGGTFYDVDLRVGGPRMDNTHLVNRRPFPSVTYGSLASQDGIRNYLWLLTDRTFKQASEQLVNVRTRSETQIDTDGPAFDLAPATKVSHAESQRPIQFTHIDWEKRLQRISNVFNGHPKLLSGNAQASVVKNVRFFVNSEGSQIQSDELMYTIVLSASTKADDGSNLSLSELFHARDPSGLPSNRELTRKADELVTMLINLRNAPNIEPYTGPAILSGRAAGVLFHEILGHRLEGHRLKQTNDAQTFKDKVNQRVLPESMSVVFDPALEKFGDTDLLGTYAFDNEGVKGQKVRVIEDGILKRFLLGRSTLSDEGFRDSNGHGRKAVGLSSVARQSNLLVEVEDPYTPAELEEQMIAILKERDLEYGLYFDDIVGGFTITQRSLPNAFTVRPVIVYKVYQDGSRELVRGVDLIGTPLAVFDSVIAGADDMAVFNGQCGAESGNVPVSAISPSILVGQIEVQRASQSRAILPILPSPRS